MSAIRTQALACREAARVIAALGTAAKQRLLNDMAGALELHSPAVLKANAEDLRLAGEKGVQGAMLDRLKLDAFRVQAIACALREVAQLPDPVGVITRRETRPNGLVIERMRVPLGVIAMIYEARPNVTADAAALCLFAGNGVILRGGSEALRSNLAIAAALHSAMLANGLPAGALTLIDDLSREARTAAAHRHRRPGDSAWW
jgi:glutamate-5-semialdehyde dehydrogenase